MEGMEGQVNDQMLLDAIRQRIMRQISSQQSISPITNNIYGTGPSGRQGVSENMAQPQQESGGGDPYEYMVDINRRDIFDPEDPERKIGWDKNVRRYRQPMGGGVGALGGL